LYSESGFPNIFRIADCGLALYALHDGLVEFDCEEANLGDFNNLKDRAYKHQKGGTL
jgi:hypothetical protein